MFSSSLQDRNMHYSDMPRLLKNVEPSDSLKSRKKSEYHLGMPQLFCHSEIESRMEEGRKISKKQLTDALNYINFQDGTILLIFKHLKYNKMISINVRPQACIDDNLDCYWMKDGSVPILASYRFQYFLLSDGLKLVLVKAVLKSITKDGISFNLPETCHEVASRESRRYKCEGVKVEVVQDGVMYSGEPLDFSPVAFRVELFLLPNQSFHWINPENTLNVMFRNEQGILYSGECKIIGQAPNSKGRIFVLEPIQKPISRLKSKEHRSLRQKLTPSPNVIFQHPLTKKMISLKVADLSSSGFSVEEDKDNSVFLLGMIIPDMEFDFVSRFRIKCKAQVIYRNVFKDMDDIGKSSIRCGFVILEIGIEDHTTLSAMLHQARDENSYICNKVDTDSLWNFLFETGFIYPKKYAAMGDRKNDLKENFEKLYNRDSDIARHFIYQEKGQIYGHMSMIRFYENSWLIHHHAAKTSSQKNAGLEVLKQIGHYVNDFHTQYPAHMNYIICYFRPENKFPRRVFGGFESSADDPKVCSIDSFAYFFLPDNPIIMEMPESWTLTETQPEDLFDLKSYYDHESGGLLLQALDLEPGTRSYELDKEYRKMGLKRERYLFSLKKDGNLKAIFMVNVSDIGLNLSDLTNCIHAFIIDPDELPKEVLNSGLSMLSRYYKDNEIPILLYPVSYATRQSVPYSKVYNLWILNLQYADSYLKYTARLLGD